MGASGTYFNICMYGEYIVRKSNQATWIQHSGWCCFCRQRDSVWMWGKNLEQTNYAVSCNDYTHNTELVKFHGFKHMAFCCTQHKIYHSKITFIMWGNSYHWWKFAIFILFYISMLPNLILCSNMRFICEVQVQMHRWFLKYTLWNSSYTLLLI